MMTRSAFGQSITKGHQRSPGFSTHDPKRIAAMGRHGDTMLAHINPDEAAMLKAHGGAGSRNPMTGLPEFYGASGGDASGVGGGSGGSWATYGGWNSAGSGSSGSISRGPAFGGGPDIYGQQQAFNTALAAHRGALSGGPGGGFYSALAPNPEIGPGAYGQRARIDAAQPTMTQGLVARGMSMAMPFGFSAEAAPNYVTGKPDMVISGNPIGALANMSPMGPAGDMFAPSWANFEVSRAPFGDPTHDRTGREGGESQNNTESMGRALLASVLGGQEPATPAETPQKQLQQFTPFKGNPATYGQPGGFAAEHRYFT